MPHTLHAPPPLRRDLPLSVVLGAGGVRGLAHVGVLEALRESGFRVTEMTGTSVGALVIAYHAAVGAGLDEIRALGLEMTTRHLLAWAWLRRAPEAVRRRFGHRAGPIPESLARMAAASWEPLHHGVERIGLVAYDTRKREQIVGHSAQREIALVDAARGAASLPGIFPPVEVVANGRQLRLVDGGVVNRLPVDVLFAEPFRPAQILAVDISNTHAARRLSWDRVVALRRAHPDVPIHFAAPPTIGHGTILYRRETVRSLIAAGYETILSSSP